MSLSNLVVLAVLFFLTSVVGVVTGSNSLVTVPVMFQFGIDEKVAVATNMFGLTFMAVGGTIPFVRQGSIEIRRLWPLLILTVIGSALGAALVGFITNQAIKLIVSIAMIVIVIFTFTRPKGNEKSVPSESHIEPIVEERRDVLRFSPLALVATFLLAIYGGLYSGGYVTVLTATLVAFAGMTFSESIAATKLINVFSSGIATLVFMWQGLVDYGLGIILAVSMFAGAYVGAHYAARMNELWLRRIFLTTVLILAGKMFVDLF
ncbi:MAG TPA: sulfite exporter TauE/SafE family protein [Pyrinomonadaceae bacterium]